MARKSVNPKLDRDSEFKQKKKNLEINKKTPPKGGPPKPKLDRVTGQKKSETKNKDENRFKGEASWPKGAPGNLSKTKKKDKPKKGEYKAGDLNRNPDKAYYSPSLGRYVTGSQIKAQAAADREKMQKNKKKEDTHKKLEEKATAEDKKKAANKAGIEKAAKRLPQQKEEVAKELERKIRRMGMMGKRGIQGPKKVRAMEAEIRRLREGSKKETPKKAGSRIKQAKKEATKQQTSPTKTKAPTKTSPTKTKAPTKTKPPTKTSPTTKPPAKKPPTKKGPTTKPPAKKPPTKKGPTQKPPAKKGPAGKIDLPEKKTKPGLTDPNANIAKLQIASRTRKRAKRRPMYG